MKIFKRNANFKLREGCLCGEQESQDWAGKNQTALILIFLVQQHCCVLMYFRSLLVMLFYELSRGGGRREISSHISRGSQGGNVNNKMKAVATAKELE